MAAEGWFRLKLCEAEPMPNSDVVQIDFVEKKELYQEFKSDLLCLGTVEDEVPSYDVWHRVWSSSFKNLRVREHRSVDSKDKVRAWLRQALRDKKHYNKQDREYLTNLRVLYAGSIRRERQFYWEARVLPGVQPLLGLCYIQDGATQACRRTPRRRGTCRSPSRP